MTAQPPRRRWPRRLGIAVAVVVGLVAALWLVAPIVIASIANRRLPHRVDAALVIERVHPRPPANPMDVLVRCSGPRLRAIAAAEGAAIPPLVLLQGLSVDARWDDRESAPELPLGLRLTVDHLANPPALAATVPAEGLNALIARNHVEPEEILGQSMHYVYRLDPGSTARDDGAYETTARGVLRRIRVEASGEVAFTLGSDRCEIRVSRMVGTIAVEFIRREGTWVLEGTVAVETCEQEVVSADSLLLRAAATNLRTILGEVLDQALDEHLADVVLPGWFPTDARISAVLR